jgi:phosphate butyryltransferase
MFHSFAEIESYVLKQGIRKKIVLMNAHDSHSLPAIVDAKRKGVVTAVLIGDSQRIREMLKELGEPEADYEILHNTDDVQCAQQAIALVKEGKADYPMKGLMQTSDFMRAILDKENGLLPPGSLLSQATVVENPEENRIFLVTDCAINITPDYTQKVKIVENAVALAHRLGYKIPKVAAISALEIPNPKIPSTVDARALQEANGRGEITGCVIGGPLALDNAVSVEAARHKGVEGPVAGNADILLMPDLAAGNIFTKSLTFYAKMASAGTLLGTSCPVIAASRTDTPHNKYYAILTALLQSLEQPL